MSEKTAVEQLEEYLGLSLGPDRMRLLANEFEKAKELEIEQHREKWRNGFDDAHDLIEYFREQGLNIRSKKNEQTKQI